MAGSRQVTIEIIGDPSSAQKAFGKVSDAGDSMKSSLGRVAEHIAGVFGGLQLDRAVEGVKSIVSDSLSEAREAQKVGAQTGAVLKSTGEAAHVSADQIGEMATALSEKVGIDDEAIQSGENLLLTFTNVKNEAGAGNDIFTQSTAIMTDMSVALGQDMSSSAIQLGKALNDPVKGVTALQRVGVSFTADQKEQIKTLVEHGNTLGAQKLILAELTKEFGGSAAAQATAGDRLKVTFKNIEEALGARLLPVIDKVATWLADNLPGAFDAASAAIGRIMPVVHSVADAISIVVDLFRAGFANPFAEMGPHVSGFERTMMTVGAVIRQVADFIRDYFKPILVGLALIFAPGAALIGGLIYAYTHFEGFRRIVDLVAHTVVEQLGAALAWVQTMWPQVSEAIGHVMVVVQDVTNVVLGIVKFLWHAFGDDILNIVGVVWGVIRSTIENALTIIRNVIGLVLALINGDWGKAWDALKNIVGAVLDEVWALLKGAVGIVKSLLGAIVSVIEDVAKAMWEPIKAAFRAVINFIIDKWNSIEFKVPKIDIAGVSFGGFTIGLPDIPRLHGGGVFRSPFAGGEGLALLRDRERVITPEQDAGGTRLTLVAPVVLDGREIARASVTYTWRELVELARGNGSLGF